MSLTLHRLVVVAVVGTSLAASPALVPAAEPQTIRLAITPAVEPLPALKYQLLPTFLDRRPGNAALDYGRAFAHHETRDKKFEQEWSKWLELSPAEFATATAGRDLASLRGSGTINLLHLAARCEQCDWQLPIRDQSFFTILLPHLTEMRRAGRIAAINVRLNVQEQNYAEALRWLQTGYALGRHAAAEPTLVSGLVGLSITAMMDRARQDWLQASGAPSLYWAETFLPRPLIDGRPGFEAEMCGPALTLPGVRNMDRTAEAWNDDAQKLLRELPMLLAVSGEDTSPYRNLNAAFSIVRMMMQVGLRRDELRAFLVRLGEKPAAVEKMTDAQLLLVYTRTKYEELRDDMFRWLSLPYPEARRGVEAAERRLAKEKKEQTELIPLAALMLPAVSAVKHSHAKGERHRDVHRLLEALRLYAGKHDGALPKSLDELAEWSPPKLDAVSGLPFDYALNDGRARLTLPEELRTDKTSLVFEITVRKE
jgi:hypothetical protein